MNVASGYLSVLLGYLCLSRRIRERFGDMGPLVKSVQEFLAVNVAADYAATADGQLSSSIRGLQSLVEQLQSTY